MWRVRAARWVVIVLMLAGCGAPPAISIQPSSQASSSPSTVRLLPKGERQPILDRLTSLGYTCGRQEKVGESGQPAVRCAYPGAVGSGSNAEGIWVYGLPTLVWGIRLRSSDGARLTEFLATFGSAEMSQYVFREVAQLRSDNRFPRDVQKQFGEIALDIHAEVSLDDLTVWLWGPSAP